MKVIFILGSGHCGSTLLDLILDAHSKVVGVGEMHSQSPSMQCTCLRPMTDCPFWTHALAGTAPKRADIYRSKAGFLWNVPAFSYVAGHETVDTGAFRTRIVAAYARMLEGERAEVIVDSSKCVERAYLLAADPQIEPVVVHLVRDARAVTWSYLRKYKKLMPYFLIWFLENVKVEIFKRRFKGVELFVRYEDLVQYPERELTRILKAVDLGFEPAMLDFAAAEHHQIGGNRMRFTKESTLKTDEAWRADMPGKYRYLTTLVFGWLNTYYRNKRV
jgi:hypothetical protein